MNEITTVGLDLAKRVVSLCGEDATGRVVVHRLRQGRQEERTAGLNRLRGLLAEVGRVYPNSASAALAGARSALADETLPPALRRGVARQLEHLREIEAHLADCDREIAQDVRDDPRAQRVARLSGVGVLTASAIAATVADPQQFRCGRQFAAWLGITPRQYSTGGKPRLGRITRRGDTYLRSLLVQGARSALQAALRAAPTRSARFLAWLGCSTITQHGRIQSCSLIFRQRKSLLQFRGSPYSRVRPDHDLLEFQRGSIDLSTPSLRTK